MIRKITALVAATALAATALAPAASARDYHHDRGGYGGGYYGDHGGYGRYHHDGDAVAIGAVGLVLGLALGSALASSSDNYDRGYAPPPPPPQYRGYEGRGVPPSGYSDGSAYAQDYGIDPKLDGGRQACTHRERQWDRYANRYVTVDVPC